ncbi:MAG: NAD(P)H-hydrate dehydratase [Rhizobiaceae bacterium]
MYELLTPDEMGRADRLAIAAGPFDGRQLMDNAGRAVAAEILARYGDAARADILCGPGNNGGDGYVVARELQRAGMAVSLHALAPPKSGADAADAARRWGGAALDLDAFDPSPGALVIDALFGAGLERPLAGKALAAVERAGEAGCRVVAVDLPSGLSGASGAVLGGACPAELTVTFFRKKPAHLLHPGRELCGEVVLADIGIGAGVLDEVKPTCFENLPPLWRGHLPATARDAHKYSRGAAAVFSGGPSSTGAARLAAMAAQRAGAGAVTVLSPPSAMLVNAGHLTSIMLRPVGDAGAVEAFLGEGKTSAVAIGPGFGVGERLREMIAAVLAGKLKTVVLDADALTAYGAAPRRLFDRIAAAPAGSVVLTPHEGEFARLFPDLAADKALSRLDRARLAAKRAGAIVVLKGPDTVVAAPDGMAAINANGGPVLATAGSGDVLAGIVTGLAAQGMAGFHAACAAVWLHAETGNLAAHGAIAEDFIHLLPAVFTELL